MFSNSRSLKIISGIIILLAAGIALAKFSPAGPGFIWQLSGEGKNIFPLVTIGALIDSINPCAFSILLLTIAFLFSLGRLRSDALRIGSFYIAGLFAAYLLIGLGILQALHFFNTPNFMGRIGAVLLIVLGVWHLLQTFFPSFPLRIRIPKFTHPAMASLMEQGSAPAAFLLGGLVGICEFPCTGGAYLMVLGLLKDTTTKLSGGLYLIYYNLVFVLPLVLILSFASNKALLEKVEKWQKGNVRLMHIAGGIAMVVLGGIIFLI